MKTLMFAGAVAVAVASAGAETVCTWTGAENAYWTNANNWAEGVVPGQYKALDAEGAVQTVGDFDNVAAFPSVSEGAATTVNLDGLWGVAKITVRNGAPRYVFGASNTQVLSMRPKTSGAASFIVESGAQGAEVAAKFGLLGSLVGSVQVENWSAGELTFDVFGYNDQNLGNNHRTYTYVGTGDIRIKKCGSHNFLMYDHSLQLTGGKLYVDCALLEDMGCGEFWSQTRVPSGYTSEIVLGDNGVIGTYSMYGDFDFGGTLCISGTGKFQLRSGGTKDGGTAPVPCQTTGKVVFDAQVVGKDSAAGWFLRGAGTVEFNKISTFQGGLNLVGGGTAQTGLIGSTGGDSNIGSGIVRLGGNSRFLYTGTGETTDRIFSLTNVNQGTANVSKSTVAAAGIIEQGGTGKLTVVSDLRAYTESADGAKLILANSQVADAEWAGVLADCATGGKALNVVKRGTGKWILSGANTYTGTTTIEGGTLELASDAALGATSSLTISGAQSHLAVADGVNVSLAAMAQSGSGTVDLTFGEGATFKCQSLTPGTAPAWLTVDGGPAEVKADGTVAALVTRWKSAANGDWNESSNWDNGVPDATHKAFVTKDGAYEVTVSEDAAPAGALELTHGTVSVSALLPFTASSVVQVRDGGRIAVGEGGVMRFDQHVGRLVIGGEGSPSAVSVGTDGSFVYTNAASAGRIELADAGVLSVNGTATVTGSSTSSDGVLVFDGGTLAVSNGTLAIKNNRFLSGSGRIEVSGTGKIDVYNGDEKHFDVRPLAADDEIDIVLTGKGMFGRAGGFLNLGGNGGVVRMNVSLETSSTPIVPETSSNNNKGIRIGYGSGYSELNQTNGYLYSGNYGIDVGHGEPADAYSSTTGRWTLVDGKYRGYPGASSWANGWHGFSVGSGAFLKPAFGGWNYGFLTMVSGTVEAGYGALGVGLGRATGVIVIQSGTFSYSSALDGRRLGNVVGFAGGDGTIILSNGTFSVTAGRLYLGGCLDADLQRKTAYSHPNNPAGGQTSTGLLSVQGGSFSAADGVTVGADGTGTLEFGPSGKFMTKDLVLSNQVASVLKYDFTDTCTIATVTVTNLVITDGAKLVIDATKLTGRWPTWTRLMAVSAVTGRFADGKVEVRSDGTNPRFDPSRCEVLYARDGEPGLWFRTAPQGVLFIVR